METKTRRAYSAEYKKEAVQLVNQPGQTVAGVTLDIRSVGFRETKPAANNETAEGRTRNRRIDVVIFDAGTLEAS